MRSVNKIASGAVWSILVNIVNAVYGFISVPILINHYGKGSYGLIGLALSVNVYMQLMDMGLNSTNVRFFSVWLGKGDNNHVNKLFKTSLSLYGIIGLINTLVLLVVTFFSNSIFNVDSEQSGILKSLLLILSATAFINWYSSCFDQLIRATENVAWLQRRNIIPKILLLLVLFVSVYFDFPITLYFLLTICSSLVIIPLSLKKIIFELPFISFKPSFDRVTFKEILPYSLGIFSFSIFEFSFANLRPVFLGIRGTMESVADYRVLNGITSLVLMISSVFMGVLLPTVSRVASTNNSESIHKVAYDGTKYLSIIICFCVFGLININKELITLYVGEDYLYLSNWLILWLFFTLGSHNTCISSLIFAGSNINMVAVWSAISSILGLVLSWLLIPVYQVGGVVIAYCAYIISQALFYYLYYWRVVLKLSSFKVFRYSFIPYVLMGVLAVAIVSFIPSLTNNTWYIVCTKSFIFSVIFIIMVLLSLNKTDYSFLKSIFKFNK